MPNVVVDANTGNVLVVHRRSLGIASALFFIAILSFILAHYTVGEPAYKVFDSLGSLCCSLLLLVLFWRCCRSCCVSRSEATGYIVVQNTVGNTNASNPQPYPVQPPSVPFMAGTQPPFMAGTQPPFNPNMIPSGAVLADAPPCYADALKIPVKN